MRCAAALPLASLLCGPLAQAADPPAPPLVIAHRGASGYLPEHTLAGDELAFRLRADYIEPDLQMTSDGVLVALHDDTLPRTTTGKTTYPRFTPRFAELSVPTSDEVIAFAKAQRAIAGRMIDIDPEAKQADPAMEDTILANADPAAAAAEFDHFLAMRLDGLLSNYPDLAAKARDAFLGST